MDRLLPASARYIRLHLLPIAVRGERFRCAGLVRRRRFLVLASAMLLTACSQVETVPQSASTAAVANTPSPTVLRVRVDDARNRTWVLSLDHLAVYDRATRRLIRRIELPDWSVADTVCPPGLLVDGEGTAFISHNIEPKLWEIHPQSFELKEHVLRLIEREQLDIGLSNLAVASRGALVGTASTGGSVWRIDLENATAREVEDTRADGC